MDDLYPVPWAGVAVCCCGSCGGCPVVRGMQDRFPGFCLRLRDGGDWDADWAVGGRELVFVNMYAPPKSEVFILYYCK